MSDIAAKTYFSFPKPLLAAILAGLLLPAAGAGAQEKVGFNGPGPDLATVAEVSKMKDDARVSLQGNLVKHLGDEVYLFQDATGAIEVEIEAEAWRGISVKPEDLIVISGEVDKDWSHTSIDVSSVSRQ